MIMQSTLNSNNKNFVTKAVITCAPQNEGYPHSIQVQSLQYQIVCLLWEHTCTCTCTQRAVSASRVLYTTCTCTYHIFWWGDILYTGSPELHPVGAVTMLARLRVEVEILWYCEESCITQGHTHANSAPEKGLVTSIYICKSLGLWKCWTVTCRTNGLCWGLNKRHSCNGIIPLYNFIGCFQNLRNWACASEPNSLWELGLEFSDLWSHSQATLESSLVPRLSPQKRGGVESLVTSARKAVDFRHVIIHVIIVGHSYFSNNCHVI